MNDIQQTETTIFDRRRDLITAGDNLLAMGVTKESYPNIEYVSKKTIKVRAEFENWTDDKLRTMLFHFEKVLKYFHEDESIEKD